MSEPLVPEPHVAAADPTTPPDVLASIVATYPELALVVRANPACYPELAEHIDTYYSAPPDPGPEPPARPRRTGLKVAVASGLVVAIGLVGGGFYLGWTAQAEVAGRETSSTPFVVPVGPTAAPGDAATATSGYPMPDLRGLAVETAQSVLADLAVTPDALTLVEQPAAGPRGVVIEQSPAHGASAITDVRLTVSVETTVPDVAKRSRDEVIDELAALGAEVVEEFRYVPGTTAGTVLSSEPAAGAPLPATVTIVVSESPATIYLAELSSVEGSCSLDAESVDGGLYDRSVVCTAGEEPSSVSWVVARAADRLRAVVGIPDSGDPASRVRVRILGDGEELSVVTAKYGDAVDLDVPVEGVLRLTIVMTLTKGGGDWGSADVALGDVRLEGGTVAMAVLTAGAP